MIILDSLVVHMLLLYTSSFVCMLYVVLHMMRLVYAETVSCRIRWLPSVNLAWHDPCYFTFDYSA